MIVTMTTATKNGVHKWGISQGEALAEYDAQPFSTDRVPKIGGVVSSIMYSMDMYGL